MTNTDSKTTGKTGSFSFLALKLASGKKIFAESGEAVFFDRDAHGFAEADEEADVVNREEGGAKSFFAT